MHGNSHEANPDSRGVASDESPTDGSPVAVGNALQPIEECAEPRPVSEETVGESAGITNPSNELETGSFHCVTEHGRAGYIHSARAGHITRHNGPRLLPRWKPRSVITYTIIEDSFPTKAYAKFAQRALVEAAEDWNDRDVGVRFRLVGQGERAVFALKYYRRTSGYFADSFFPDSETRILYIFTFSFRSEYRRHMANIFRHEIGHILGLRHEGAEANESEFPSVELTPQNGLSIMACFTDPSTIHIQESDVAAARKLCTINQETFHGFEVVTVDPDTLDQVSFNDSDRLSSRGSDFASTTTEGSNSAVTEEESALVDADREETSPVSFAREGESAPVNSEALVVPNTVRSEGNSTPRSLENTDTRYTSQFDGTFDLDLQNALTPDLGTEERFLVQDNPFAFSPGQLGKLLCPKSHSAFYALGGLFGLEIGLRTDRKAGLSIDETVLDGVVSFEDAATRGIPRYGELGEKAPEPRRSEDCTPPPPYAYRLEGSKTGGTDRAFTDRKRVFQTNRLPERKVKPIIWLARDVYCSGWIFILLTFATIASLAWGVYRSVKPPPRGSDGPGVEWAEGLAILVCIALIIAIETGYQWKTKRHFDRLDDTCRFRPANVMRSGRMRAISASDVLVGDVVYISTGDIIPADGILIDGYGLKCDESACTGESGIITKIPGDQTFTVLDDAVNGVRVHPRSLRTMDPFIISGGLVIEGSGSFIATAVGINSVDGLTAMSLRMQHEFGSQVQRLESLGTSTLRRLGFSVVLLFFITSTIKFLATLPSSTLTPEEKGRNYLGLFVMSLALSVVVTPPFLSNFGFMVTAFAMKKMLQDRNLVRSGKACEAVAKITTICTSKTGVLTQGRMRVVAATIGRSKQFRDANLAIPPDDEIRTLDSANGIDENTVAMASIPFIRLASSLSSWEKDLLVQSIVVNSTAFESENEGERSFVGSKIESTLLTFSRDYLGSRPVHEERCNASVVQLLPFKAGNKFMATTVMLPHGVFRVYVKGAAEILLSQCAKVIANTNPVDGEISTVDLADRDRELLELRVASYGSQCLRPIGLCYRDFSYYPSADDLETGGGDLTLLAILGIQDPLRHNVIEAVKDCRRAGIAVRMVTNDHLGTAVAIAQEVDMLMGSAIALEGRIFRAMTAQQQLQVLPRIAVLARASPEDERIIVKRLEELGETVAVTGGGVDDRPALRRAHVGFAKGITGSEAAKQAADVILMDDSFVSIVKCITWGRTVKDSIGKLLQYKLAAIAITAATTFVSASAKNASDSPVFNAAQLLWIGLMTDLAVLALISGRPTKTILDRQPSPMVDPIITVHMIKMIMGQVICQLFITLVMLFAWFRFPGYAEKTNMADAKTRRNTFVFNAFVWLQIFNILNSRRLDNRFNVFEGVLQNTSFFLVGFLLVGGQVLIMLVGGVAFNVAHLSGPEWAISVGIGPLSLLCGVLLCLIPDRVIDRLIPEIVKHRLIEPRPAVSFHIL